MYSLKAFYDLATSFNNSWNLRKSIKFIYG